MALRDRVAAVLLERESGRRLAAMRARLPADMESWTRGQASLYAATRIPDFEDCPAHVRRPFERRAEEILSALDDMGVMVVDVPSGEVLG